MILGKVRSITQPILFRFWLKRTIDKIVTTRIGGFTLRILPTVFHPKYFGSSLILSRYVQSQNIRGKRFLDMGTGSGIVGIFAARSGAEVTAVDINPAAVRCATMNAAESGLTMDCRQSDLFAALQNQRFDVIAWNPPFFPRPATNVADVAFYAGSDYASIRRFAREVRSYLAPEGRILLVLSTDVDVGSMESWFRSERFTVTRALSRWWGLGETMVVLDIR
jgi:release factor glutamine methyltransferase